MDLTVDVRISGCATRCRHCYVDGGPGPLMPLPEYRRCLDVLRELFDRLQGFGFDVYLWLDYEPLLHPDICEILRLTRERFPGSFDISCMPTSGIPLATRGDWREVLEVLEEVGTKEMMFTLHGPEEIHDRAVSLCGAYSLEKLAVDRVREYGFGTMVKVIVSKEMIVHFEETMMAVDDHGYDHRFAEVPVYEPLPRLRDFESLRAALEDVQPFVHRLSEFCDRGKRGEYWKNPEKYAERNIRSRVLANGERYSSFTRIEERMPSWMFVNVMPGLSLHYGNAGLSTRRIGSLDRDSPEALAEKIRKLEPNYMFRGFYDVENLPPPASLAREFGDPNSGRLYASEEDLLLRWLDMRDLASQA